MAHRKDTFYPQKTDYTYDFRADTFSYLKRNQLLL